MQKENSIIIYEDKKTGIKLETHLENEDIWLTQEQIGKIFGVKKAAVSKHLKNIFESGELEEKPTVSKTETVQKVRKFKFNLFHYGTCC